MEKTSEKLIHQRIRNRIIEVLEIMASYDKQERFGGDELLNLWEDWVDEERLGSYREPVFTLPEQEQLSKVQHFWLLAAENTPNPLPDISELMSNDDWAALQVSASDALAVFSFRGKFSEEREIT